MLRRVGATPCKEAPCSVRAEAVVVTNRVTELSCLAGCAVQRSGGFEIAAERGVIIADTKLEFGRAPDRLVSQVRDLLRTAGKQPSLATDERLAVTGTCMLLRSLGITPATDPVDAYRRILDSEPWPDTDDRRATEHA